MTPDLSTRYCGLELTSPLVASSGPLTGRLDTLERLAGAGVAAVVLPSLFEEEIVHGSFNRHAMYEHGAEIFAEALTYHPELPVTSELDRTLALIAAAKTRLEIPVIASLNGTTPSGWARYAADLADAGADAIELNLYMVAADPTHDAAAVEQRQLELVGIVREAVDVPLAVKLSPYFTALAHTAVALADAGADALVLFNRFYQPDIDLETLAVVPDLVLSTSDELRLPLRWIALLHGLVPCALAASTGIHTADDVVKALLAGADVAMSTSALLERGPEHVAVLRAGLARWLDEREYESVAQLRGSVSARGAGDPDAYERANYFQVIRRFSSRYVIGPTPR